MRRLLASLVLLVMAGCGKLNTLNSVSTDPYRFSASGSPEFVAARTVFVEKCSSCHFEFATYSESEWKATGWVISGDPTGSFLFGTLRGSGVPGGEEDMPPDGALSAGELGAIEAWIEALP
ncbi:MAG: hypothetical protein ACK5QT_05395 [Oligoflexia bacterium]